MVANALKQYVGALHYETDDESDAVAIGIAWLIENNCLHRQSIFADMEV